MESKPLISIIIPCYNDAQYIKQSVLSALNQSYPNKEVIVVDDGSNAETKTVLKKLAPQITKLITQQNQGQSMARNVGIKESKGYYILVLDSDDYFEPTFCEKAIEVFLNNKDIKIVTCQANLLFEDGSVSVYKPKGGGIDDFLYSNVALGSLIFKKIDWISCNGYDENMRQGFEDWEFYIRLLQNGGNAVVIQEPLFNYRKRKISTTSKANTIKYELMYYIFMKHKELFIENYENFIRHMLDRIKVEEDYKIKYLIKSETKFINFLKSIKYFFNR